MEQGAGGGSLHWDEPTGKQHLAEVMERMQKWAKNWFALANSGQRDLVKTSRKR
jgi:hypothetical protein